MASFMFLLALAVLLLILYRCFFSPWWHKNLIFKLFLFFFPFIYGWSSVFLLCRLLSAEMFNTYHHYIYFYTIASALSLIPQWYKFMWLLLKNLSVKKLNEGAKLISVTLFSALMITMIVFFFTLYYLWIDALSGYTQGLRSGITNQPILLTYQSAFYFSFVTYFSLGYGDLVPYGSWFHLMVFLECLISLLNAGIIVIYAYNLLFSSNSSE